MKWFFSWSLSLSERSRERNGELCCRGGGAVASGRGFGQGEPVDVETGFRGLGQSPSWGLGRSPSGVRGRAPRRGAGQRAPRRKFAIYLFPKLTKFCLFTQVDRI
eukprot:4811936-Prymnesium_polylepis.1